MAELAPTEDSRHHNTKHATPVKSGEQQIDLRMIQRLTKMTGETPEVRSDKRKPREKKEREKMSRINYYQSAFNLQKEKLRERVQKRPFS